MGSDTFPTERLFLIGLAITQFNEQYGRSIDHTACSIFSITPDYGSALGYEINTNEQDDNVRLRMYLSYDVRDGVAPYRLEADQSKYIAGLGDELYVTTGTVSQYYVDSGIYRFRWLAQPIAPVSPVVLINNAAWEFMTGAIVEFVSC